MSIRYYLDQNPVKPGSWRAVLLRNLQKQPLERFIKYCTEVSTVSEADALAVLSCMEGWIVSNASSGQEVDFGAIGQTRLGMKLKGVESYDQQLKRDNYSITVGWEVSRDLKKLVDDRAKQAGIDREVRSPGPMIQSIQNLMTEDSDSYTPGGLIRIAGVNLKFDPSKSAEGVFFSTGGGDEVRVDSYVALGPRAIRLLVPESLSGPLDVVIRSRARALTGSAKEFAYPRTLRQQ